MRPCSTQHFDQSTGGSEVADIGAGLDLVQAALLSTTWYLHDAVDADRAAGHEIGDATIAHLTPARFEAINPYGLLTFEVAKILNRTNRRPFRTL